MAARHLPQAAAEAPAPGLRERKKAQLRQRIAETTLRLVAERGYGGVTIDEIAAQAEISQPTFYKYFPSKDAVLMERALLGFGGLLDGVVSGDGSVVERLRQYFRAIATQVTADRDLWFAIALSNAYNPIRDPGLLSSAQAGTRALERVIAEGQARGELTGDVTAQQLASVLEGVMMRACIEWGAGFPDGGKLVTRMDAMFDFFMRGAAA